MRFKIVLKNDILKLKNLKKNSYLNSLEIQKNIYIITKTTKDTKI